MKKRFSEVQIIGFLREAEARDRSQRSVSTTWILRSQLLPLAEHVRRHDRARRQATEGTGTGEYSAEEVTGGDAAGASSDPRGAPKKVVRAPARREGVRWMCGRGLTKRCALKVMSMSASSLRYRPAPDRNAELRNAITTLAARHPRYGAGMMYFKLRQQGHMVNHKRVDRLYREAQLQLRRRTRKQIPRGHASAAGAAGRREQVWYLDFVFDRSAEGRVIKCLTIVDDATHESVAIVPERTLGGTHVTQSWISWRRHVGYLR